MISNLINKTFSQQQFFRHNTYAPLLTLQLKQNIVVRYQPRRSPFDKTAFNENWIPRQKLYHKSRKPRQPQWEDPNFIFPLMIPPMHKPIKNYREFVRKNIESQERQKSFRRKQFLMSDIRPGDIIDITYQETFESQQKVTHRCFVLSYKRRNSLTAALQVAIRFGGMGIKAIYLIHSPKVTKIELVSKGSGNFRSNLKYNWRKMGKNQLLNPKIRNRVMKLREGAIKKKKAQRKSAIKFDKVQSDNIKKIL